MATSMNVRMKIKAQKCEDVYQDKMRRYCQIKLAEKTYTVVGEGKILAKSITLDGAVVKYGKALALYTLIPE